MSSPKLFALPLLLLLLVLLVLAAVVVIVALKMRTRRPPRGFDVEPVVPPDRDERVQ